MTFKLVVDLHSSEDWVYGEYVNLEEAQKALDGIFAAGRVVNTSPETNTFTTYPLSSVERFVISAL